MSIIKMDGFDLYADVSDVGANGWGVNTADYTLLTSGGRFGGGAIRADSPFGALAVTFSPILTVRVAAWVKVNNPEGDTSAIFNIVDESGEVRFKVNSGNTLAFEFEDDTDLVTTANVLDGAWYWVEVELVHGEPGEVRLYFDGVKIIENTSKNTAEQFSSTAWGGVDFETSSGNVEVTYDDIVVWSDDGSGVTSFPIGPQKIVTRQPSADGTTVNFTPLNGGANYEEVDESTGPDDDTTYNSSSTVGDRDVFPISALPTDISGITAVQQVTVGRKDAADTRTISHVVVSNAAEDVGAAYGLSQSYAYNTRIVNTNPDTGSAWTIAELEAAEFGYEVAG